MCTQLSPIFYNLFVLLLILLPQLRSQQRDRVGEQHLIANTSAAPKRKTMVGRNNQQRGGGGHGDKYGEIAVVYVFKSKSNIICSFVP